MRNKFNIIQINGIKGIVFIVFAAICLAAGFIVFPGMMFKLGWNALSGATGALPVIGTIQGTLLWGIVVVSYFTFKKKGFFVELKSADDLSRAEMDAVMHRIRTERQADIISKSIMRARELDVKAHSELDKFVKKESADNGITEATPVNTENSEVK